MTRDTGARTSGTNFVSSFLFDIFLWNEVVFSTVKGKIRAEWNLEWFMHPD